MLKRRPNPPALSLSLSSRALSPSSSTKVGAFVPPCVYFYLRHRSAGYVCALLLALACLLARLALLLAAAPRADAEAVAERSAALAEAPYCRGAEALLGVLVAFSFCDERFKFDGTVTGIAALDFFHGGEAAAAVEPPPAGDGGADGAGHGTPSGDGYGAGACAACCACARRAGRWLCTPRSWLHLGVVALAPLCIWEGDFHDAGAWTFKLTELEAALVAVFADFVVAAFFALLLRYLLHENLLVAHSDVWCSPVVWCGMALVRAARAPAPPPRRAARRGRRLARSYPPPRRAPLAAQGRAVLLAVRVAPAGAPVVRGLPALADGRGARRAVPRRRGRDPAGVRVPDEGVLPHARARARARVLLERAPRDAYQHARAIPMIQQYP